MVWPTLGSRTAEEQNRKRKQQKKQMIPMAVGSLDTRDAFDARELEPISIIRLTSTTHKPSSFHQSTLVRNKMKQSAV